MTPRLPSLAGLPEPVLSRIVVMTADALPDVPKLPPAVRRVAGFAPARRARLGRTAIMEALADDDFRERVGVQVAARPAPDPDDLPGAAARAWLTRPEDWEAELERCEGELASRATQPDDRTEREVERLRGRLADAEQATRELRAKQRAQVAEYKEENASLRRKLGESRASEREARADLEAATQALEDERARADTRLVAQEKELRRLRAQVEQWEAEAAQGRRDARSEREEATVRARILLETVIDAASGLRRELALPSVGGSPGDRVEAELAQAAPPGSRGRIAASSPALLEQLLVMPRARLVVDGYNVTKTGWPTASLETQRIRLVTDLAALVARTGAETTVVFDAADTDHRPMVSAPRGVKVLFSPRGVIADDVIRDLVAAEPEGRVTVAVTADQELARDVARRGVQVATPGVLLGLLAR